MRNSKDLLDYCLENMGKWERTFQRAIETNPTRVKKKLIEMKGNETDYRKFNPLINHYLNECNEEIFKQMRNIHSIQEASTDDKDPYMTGLYNGMELFLACESGNDVMFKESGKYKMEEKVYSDGTDYVREESSLYKGDPNG